jgi:hypothetical protein
MWNTEVVHSELSRDGHTIVHFETPDEKYGFKELDCQVPGFEILRNVGYTGSEIFKLVGFCKNHASLLLRYAATGGIANA